MATRIDLHNQLTALLPSGKKAYFDPPESVKMKYPCFVYSENAPTLRYSNNRPYTWKRNYTVTYIDQDPDNDMLDKMMRSFSEISAGSPYIADNLHHYPFDISI